MATDRSLPAGATYSYAQPQSHTQYQIEVQQPPVEYTTTTTTIDVNTLPSRVENGQTIYTVDLNQANNTTSRRN